MFAYCYSKTRFICAKMPEFLQFGFHRVRPVCICTDSFTNYYELFILQFNVQKMYCLPSGIKPIVLTLYRSGKSR